MENNGLFTNEEREAVKNEVQRATTASDVGIEFSEEFIKNLINENDKKFATELLNNAKKANFLLNGFTEIIFKDPDESAAEFSTKFLAGTAAGTLAGTAGATAVAFASVPLLTIAATLGLGAAGTLLATKGVESIFDAFQERGGFSLENFQDIVGDLYDGSYLETAVDFMGRNIEALADAAESFYDGVVEDVQALRQEIIDQFDVFSDYIDQQVEDFSDYLTNDFPNYLDSAWDAFKDNLTDFLKRNNLDRLFPNNDDSNSDGDSGGEGSGGGGGSNDGSGGGSGNGGNNGGSGGSGDDSGGGSSLIPCWIRKIPEYIFNRISPITLDLNGNDTIDYVNLNQSTAYFDLDATGFAQRTGWIDGGDGFLAYDRNGDGVINNITELFGEDENSGAYQKLAALNGNADTVIDANDTEFANLLIWVDENQDGFSQPYELQSLEEAGISALGLDVNPVPEASQQLGDGLVTETSYFLFDDGTAKQTADVFFNNDPIDSLYVEDFTLNDGVFGLPYIRGYGLLPDLPIAASMDASLLQTAEELIELDPRNIFGISLKLDRLLYQWAGSLGNNPFNSSRDFDDRKLGFLEQLLVQDTNADDGVFFVGAFSNVGRYYDIAKSELAKGLFIEGVYSDQFVGFDYNPFSEEVFADFQELADAIAALEDTEPYTPSEQALFWSLLYPTLAAAQQNANLDDFDARITNAIAGSGLTLDDLKNPDYGVIFDESVLTGQVRGSQGDEIIISADGDKDIRPGGGNDLTFWGNGDGNDILREIGIDGDVDTLYVELNFTEVDLEPSSQNLLITNKSSGETLTVLDFFKVVDGENRTSVEAIQFVDREYTNGELFTELNFTDINDNILTGSEGSDYLVLAGGNDTARGYFGSDRYDVYANGDHTINDFSGANDSFTDVVYLYDLTPNQVTVTQDFSSAVLTFSSGGSLTLENQLAGNGIGKIEEIRFIDDPTTVWTTADLESML